MRCGTGLEQLSGKLVSEAAMEFQAAKSKSGGFLDQSSAKSMYRVARFLCAVNSVSTSSRDAWLGLSIINHGPKKQGVWSKEEDPEASSSFSV